MFCILEMVVSKSPGECRVPLVYAVSKKQFCAKVMCRLVLCTCVEASVLQGRLWTPTRQRALSAARTRARTRFLPRLVGYDRYRPRHVVWGMSTSTRTTPPTPSSVSSTSRVGRPKSCKKSGFQYTFSRVPRQCCEHLVRGIVSKGFKKANATPSNSPAASCPASGLPPEDRRRLRLPAAPPMRLSFCFGPPYEISRQPRIIRRAG